MQAQCFTIESILVNTCLPTGTTQEGQNEMVRFTVGPSPLNTADLNVIWATAGNSWNGVCQNSSAVIQLNSTILNPCGVLLEPIGGILPANAKVFLVTGSSGFSAASNSFAALSEPMYIIFHNSTNTTGNFGNSSAGVSTFSMSFSPSVGSCSESVSYTASLLVGGNGAYVDFSPAGTATYGNIGCSAPLPVYDPSWTVPSPICAGASSINLNTLITGTTGGTWSGPGVTGNIFSPAGLSGNQSITYAHSQPCVSPVVELTQSISVIAPSILNPAWTGTSVCSNQGPIDLSLLITGTTGGTWSGTGVTGSSFDPTSAGAGPHSITYSLGSGACESSTQTLTVIQQPSTLSISGTTDYCSGETMTALSTAPSIGLTAFWFSDNALTTQVSPSNSFTPPASTSTYYVYQGTSSCHSIPTLVNITINQIPAVPVLPALVEWCSGASLPSISATSLTTSLKWFSNAALTTLVGTGNSFQITDSSIPTYYVYNEISNCQSNTVTININVKPTPSAPSIASPIRWCSGTILPSISTTSTATSINWYSNSVLTNPNLVGTGNSFQISSSSIPRYYVVGESNGCTSSASIVDFNIELPVTADIIGNAVIDACLPDVVTLQSASLSNNQWSTGATTQSIQVIQPGTYTLTVVGFCNSATDVVTINDVSVDASFQIDLENSDMLPLSATLITENNLGSNCEWFINGVLQSIPNNNTLVFNQEGTYEIMHQCSNAAGCLDKEIQFITAKFPNDFYIPTGFSPNNDGLNDVFGISGEGISKLQVVIYDSWGEEVFVIQNPDQTWDGKSISGEMLPDGLYVYKLEAHDIEGNPYYKNGTLIIIR